MVVYTTGCPKSYRKSVLHPLKYTERQIQYKLKTMSHHFAKVNLITRIARSGYSFFSRVGYYVNGCLYYRVSQKSYRKSVLHLLKYTAKQIQYRFAVNFGTLSIYS